LEKNPKTGNWASVIFGKKIQTKIQKSNFGNVWERHFWKKNPDFFHEYLVMIFLQEQILGTV